MTPSLDWEHTTKIDILEISPSTATHIPYPTAAAVVPCAGSPCPGIALVDSCRPPASTTTPSLTSVSSVRLTSPHGSPHSEARSTHHMSTSLMAFLSPLATFGSVIEPLSEEHEHEEADPSPWPGRHLILEAGGLPLPQLHATAPGTRRCKEVDARRVQSLGDKVVAQAPVRSARWCW